MWRKLQAICVVMCVLGNHQIKIPHRKQCFVRCCRQMAGCSLKKTMNNNVYRFSQRVRYGLLCINGSNGSNVRQLMEHSETQNQNKTAHKVTREYAFLAFTGLLEAQIDNESHCFTRGDDFELWWKSVMSRTLPGNRIPFRDSFRKSIQSSFNNFSCVFVPEFHSGFLMDYSSGFLQGFLHEFIQGLLQKFLPEFCPGESRGFLQNLPGISLWISARVSVKTSEQVSSGFYSETPLKNFSSDQNFLQRFVQDVANSFWNFSRGFLPTLCRRFLLKTFRDSSYAFFGISPGVLSGTSSGIFGPLCGFLMFFSGIFTGMTPEIFYKVPLGYFLWRLEFIGASFKRNCLFKDLAGTASLRFYQKCSR